MSQEQGSYSEPAVLSEPNKNEPPFKGTLNHKNNIMTVKSWEEYCHQDRLKEKLAASINLWKNNPNIHGILIEVAEAHCEWIIILIEHGFTFHHCKQQYVVLSRWMKHSEDTNTNKLEAKSNMNKLEGRSNTNKLEGISNALIGLVAIVTDDEKVLLHHDMNLTPPAWKLPLGFIKEGEDISEGTRREVFDSCGVSCDFVSVVAFTHNVKGYLFNCPEIYFVVHLKVVSAAIHAHLIDKYKFMQISEFLKYPDNCELSKVFLQKHVQNEDNKCIVHPQSISDEQFHSHNITLYTIEKKKNQTKTEQQSTSEIH